MQTGALTQHLDVAQVVLYAFWVFFFLLILYIRQEDRREGYPLEDEKTGEVEKLGWPFMPDPKTFVLAHDHGTSSFPNPANRDMRPVPGTPVGPWRGVALEPNGNPMGQSIGPGSWAERQDIPDLNLAGKPKILPLRVATDFSVVEGDPDPRGFALIGCDGKSAGTITDVWVDTSEHLARYFEADVGGHSVLVPKDFAIVKGKQKQVYVHALRSNQFAGVPGRKQPTQITMLEEEKVAAYFGSGTLYATPLRAEPIL